MKQAHICLDETLGIRYAILPGDPARLDRIAKELTEAHGGKISMESTLSKGTSVTIELPFACKLKNPEAKGGGTV